MSATRLGSLLRSIPCIAGAPPPAIDQMNDKRLSFSCQPNQPEEPMSLQLANFDAVTFDVYGTLIDWEPSIMAFLRRWADRNGVSAPDKNLLQAFDRTRAAIQKERPAPLYPQVLRPCF